MTHALRLALALALAGAATSAFPARDAAATEAPPMAVTTIAATRGTVVETVLVDGSLVAREEVLVGPQVEGLRVVELLAEEGDAVATGQPLARLDRSGLDIQLAQNDAALARAAAAIAQARSQIAQAEVAAPARARASARRSACVMAASRRACVASARERVPGRGAASPSERRSGPPDPRRDRWRGAGRARRPAP
ncbi:MAG: biotin/lipoyl-binding protein [Alphaproteobacteria bacterium]